MNELSVARQLLMLTYPKPKIGDRVRARPNSKYGITRDGWEGVVISDDVNPHEEVDDIVVRGAPGHPYAGSSFTVNSEYFEVIHEAQPTLVECRL